MKIICIGMPVDKSGDQSVNGGKHTTEQEVYLHVSNI